MTTVVAGKIISKQLPQQVINGNISYLFTFLVSLMSIVSQQGGLMSILIFVQSPVATMKGSISVAHARNGYATSILRNIYVYVYLAHSPIAMKRE